MAPRPLNPLKGEQQCYAAKGKLGEVELPRCVSVFVYVYGGVLFAVCSVSVKCPPSSLLSHFNTVSIVPSRCMWVGLKRGRMPLMLGLWWLQVAKWWVRWEKGTGRTSEMLWRQPTKQPQGEGEVGRCPPTHIKVRFE